MIIVFGSLNMDINMEVPTFPFAGETILSSNYSVEPGGKGANQALAALRSGADVAMVGKVGDDAFGHRLKTGLAREGVKASGVGESETLPTGCAVVTRVPNGENQIIVASGANMETSADQVPDEVLNESNVLLMQMEVNPDENIKLMKRAKERGVCNILNLAPSIIIPQKAISLLDYLIVNMAEAKQIAHVTGMVGSDNACNIARGLAKNCDLTCIITLGPKGAIVVTKDDKGFGVPTLPIAEMDNLDVVDTTGAGDSFCGTFAAGIHNELGLEESLRRASVASALACTKPGAQNSYPYLDDITEYLDVLPEITDACVI